MIRHALRATAVAIAIAGIVDPVLSLERPITPPLAIVIARQPSSTVLDGVDQARVIAGRLESLLAGEFQVSVRPHVPGARAAACPADGGCILISDGTLPVRLSDGAAVVGAVRLNADEVPRVSVTDIRASRETHLDAASVLEVDLEAINALGATTVQVFDGQALVGEAEHRWGEKTTGGPVSATIPLTWVPIAAGPRRLRVVAPPGSEPVIAGGEAETAVDVRTAALRVLIHEPEATWMGTFVRRALEADGRFAIEGRVQVAPAVSVTRGGVGGLRRAEVDAAQAVVSTAPERLSAGDVDLLERYVRVRGGSLVLAPDKELSGPILRLLPAIDRVQHEAEPQVVGELRARDVLTFSRGAVSVLASAAERPVIVSHAIGRGRVVISGALDAWRYRDDGSFARFWSSLMADAASAGGPTVRLDVGDSLLEPGEETRVHVEWRTMDEIPGTLSAAAEIECGGQRTPIRLWPDARRGSFTGSFEATRAGTCVVTAGFADGGPPASTAVVVASGILRPVASTRAVASAMAANGAAIVGPGDLTTLAEKARALVPARRERRETRPMRSAWWLIPFAVCLGAEWTLRRRAGLR